MKKIIGFFLFILCLFVASSLQVNATSNYESDIIKHQASSVTVVSSDDQKVLFKITSNIDDVDALTNEAIKKLKGDMDSDISINADFCRIPNAPYNNIELHYHIVQGNGYCKTYYQTARYCLNCGEVYNYNSEKVVSRHRTTPNCP